MHPIAHNKGKELIVPDDVDTLADDELSSENSPSLSISLEKNTRTKSHKRTSHRLAFSNAVSGASSQAKRKARRGQNQPNRVLGNVSILPSGSMPPMSLVHLTFNKGPTFYMLPTALIQELGDMLSLPLRQHILDYEPPRRFVIPAFSTFDGSADPLR